jgi:uncharacterized membrane protein
MVVAVGTFTFNALFLLHILAVLVAFAPNLARTPPRPLHAVALVLAGLFGLGLVFEQDYEFSEPWISIAFLLWFLMLGVVFGFLVPLGRRRSNEPAESAKSAVSAVSDERAQMLTGMLHVLLLLMLIDMIWKPGL